MASHVNYFTTLVEPQSFQRLFEPLSLNLTARHYYLDWLRVLVILNLIPFHAAWAIEYVPGFSQNPGDTLLDYVLEFYIISTSRWQMPLLFFISGMSTWIALGYKTSASYSSERIKRLLVPLVFFMLFLFQPLAFFWPGTPGDKSLSFYFLEFWPSTLLNIFYHDSTGGPGWAHMWFVAYLLIFSFIMLPWFIRLRRNAGILDSCGIIHQNLNFVKILLPGLAFVLILMALEPIFPGHRNNLYTDWTYFNYNLLSFILGFILCENKAFWMLVQKNSWWLVFFGVVVVFIQILIVIFLPSFTRPEYHYEFWLYTLPWGLNTWLFILAFLGLAKRYMNLDNRFLRYFSPASYPIYIIHLVIMVVIGYYMRPWENSLLSEFLVLSLSTFAGTILVYEIIKRNIIGRFLFGMK